MFKIAITGPESTGKSTLAEKLARHFNVDFIPEYSRTYLENFEGHFKNFGSDSCNKRDNFILRVFYDRVNAANKLVGEGKMAELNGKLIDYVGKHVDIVIY